MMDHNVFVPSARSMILPHESNNPVTDSLTCGSANLWRPISNDKAYMSGTTGESNREMNAGEGSVLEIKTVKDHSASWAARVCSKGFSEASRRGGWSMSSTTLAADGVLCRTA